MAGEGFQLRLVRTKADALDDPDPNAVPPPATEWLRLATYRESANRPIPTVGYHAKLVFTVPGNTATVECWTLNTIDNSWAPSGSLALVPDRRLFFQNDINDAIVYFRLRGITGGNPIEVWAEEM